MKENWKSMQVWAAEIHGPSKDHVECLKEEKEEHIVVCSCLSWVLMRH